MPNFGNSISDLIPDPDLENIDRSGNPIPEINPALTPGVSDPDQSDTNDFGARNIVDADLLATANPLPRTAPERSIRGDQPEPNVADATGNAPEFESEADSSTLDVLGDALNFITPGPNVRYMDGISNRDSQVMTWRLPSGVSVQMYINPENFSVRESKQITATRTKGGFVVQYWGDNLTELTLSGTTGSSGVRGIQVLRDIYRAENKGFELVAATQLQEILEASTEFATGDAAAALDTAAQAVRERNFVLRPSLASLALSLVLFYQGIEYRGYFTGFSMTESISKLGLFDYSMTFQATQIRGKRDNFMPWHKEPLADDAAGQLLNGIGNAIRGAIGLEDQAPEQFHPDSAPLSFGGNDIATTFDIDSDGIIF